jgi:type II secretory pathway component PulM
MLERIRQIGERAVESFARLPGAILGWGPVRRARDAAGTQWDRLMEIARRTTAPALAAARGWYDKREPREKLLLRMLGAVAGALLLWNFVYVPVSGLGGDLSDRIAARRQELTDVQAQMLRYQLLRRDLAATEKHTVSSKDFSLFSVVEQALTASIGHEKISSITPSERTLPGGFHQHVVDLKLSGLSLAQVVNALYSVQTLSTPVTVSSFHLRPSAPGARSYDVDMTCAALGREAG